MPLATEISTAEEEAFMARLLTDPPVTPTRQRGVSSDKHGPLRQDSEQRNTSVPEHPLYSVGRIDLEEEISGWDWDALSDYVPTPKKPRNSPKSVIPAQSRHHNATPSVTSKYVPDPCTRCSVRAVTDTWSHGQLLAATEPGLELVCIILRDDWVYTDIHEGDVVNVIGMFHKAADGQKSITVTTLENLLIHHPDTLLTPSLLASAPNCQRRPLITMLLRTPSPPTPALVYGTVLHNVLQKCLQEKRWDMPWMEAHVEAALSMAFGDLVRAGITLSIAKDETLRRAVGVKAFGERYIGDNPKPDAALSDTRASRGETALLAICSLHDIEEDIWSPTYGLRGKLDASVQAVVFRNPGSSSTHPAPLEIKTGRTVAGLEHRAQTMLYTLLMQERYDDSVDLGLLYYTQSEELISVPVTRLELRALVGVRNAIAEWMARRFRGLGRPWFKDNSSFLPSTINNESLCGRCYALDACMLYRRAVENIADDVSPIADIYAEKTGHLSQPHADFFKTWEQLIALEEQDMMRFKKELWTLGAGERESLGRCFADMVLDISFLPNESVHPEASRIHSFTYRFHKRMEASAGSLLNGHMNVGDAVTVSVAPDLLALCRGFILELDPKLVILGVDHKLNINAIQAQSSTADIVFRIDKDEFSAGMGRVRENLATLFYVGGDKTRLRLVVDLAPPIFDSENQLLTMVRASSRCRALARSLNADQILAVEQVLRSCDYTLVLGLPGTGKTTVVAHLIRMLVEMGKTVLLSAYTHSAVDTILAKLDGIHPDSRKYHLSTHKKPTTIEEFERQFMTPRVVATTALSIDQKGGLDVSLFRRLSEAHPHAVVELTQQYRMNADIMLLSNKLVYDDHLSCGNQKVANQSLIIPNHTFIQDVHVPTLPSVFVNTDDVPARESHVGDLVQNVTEALLVQQFTECLIGSGIGAEQIGVVALYRQQIKLLSYLLRSQPSVEILTADRSQGRDKDCIIMSMVRSNEEGTIGDLVKDWRRMNVAFTRARSKLVIFGSRSTLTRTPLLESFFKLMESEGWIFRLPSDAHEAHAGALFSSQDVPNKRTRDGDGHAERDNTKDQHDREGNKRKRLSPNRGLLRGRPILTDVFNDTIDLT
ncbi:AAA domain-containing protein [Russula earlei]|uniref:AAA domain-containing protein n=1 Tax=Russula earlei TaxID=71964 RepID=A0ACC0U174_9AGAM|nr:AAA domain-containing protein [Russula earlei]